MGTMNKLFLVIAFIAAGTFGASAKDLPSGRDIAVKMDAVDTSRDMKATAVMVIDRQGTRLTRRMEISTKKFGPDERRLITFMEPPDVRGTLYLTWSYEASDRTDDMWVFLPAESLVRRISGGGKKGAFMRSDFANEDIEPREVDDDTHELLRSEVFSGSDCWVINSVPMDKKDTHYSKRILWVDKELFLPLRIEYYDHRNRLLKTGVFGGFEKINNIWTAMKIMVETPKRKSKTLMQYKDLVYDQGLSDALFEKGALKR
jgi:outer membrane lipoprotein-sorting protein